MRPCITIALLVLATGTLVPGCGGSATQSRYETAQHGRDQVDFSALPSAGNRDALADLNRRQRRMVRSAQRSCSSVEDSSLGAGGCIISWVDRAVAQEDDEALLAFHYALPPRYRYDPERPNSIGMNVHRYIPVFGAP